MKRRQPTSAHRGFRDDMIEVLRKNAGDMDALDMLAVASHLVGQLVALQDHRTVTAAMAMQVVSKNIEQGNADVVGDILNSKGSA